MLCLCANIELIKESDSHLSVYRTRGAIGGKEGGIVNLEQSKLKTKRNPALKKHFKKPYRVLESHLVNAGCQKIPREI